MHSFKVAGKNPQDVDMIILSHIHWDHTGGVSEFLESKTGIDVYMPQSFPIAFKKDIEALGANPGIEDILTKAQEIKDEQIQYAAPTHCSRDGTIKVFQEVFGEQYLKVGTGKVIQTADL